MGHNQILADTTDVTFNGLTDDQVEVNLVQSTTTKTPAIIDGSTFTAAYSAPGDTKVTIASANVTRVSGSPTKIDFETATFHTTNTFYPGQKVKVECTDDSGTRNLGFYTVSDPSDSNKFNPTEGMNANYIYVDEYV